MEEKTSTQTQVIEPEILDENGIVVSTQDNTEIPHSHVYQGVGMFTGFFALAFSFILILLGALITVFVIAPILLLGRILGLQVKHIRR